MKFWAEMLMIKAFKYAPTTFKNVETEIEKLEQELKKNEFLERRLKE